jgi:RHS repeat-associated protein
VRATSSDHPGSTGGYRGQYTIYNNMGRVAQQSNPTEINTYWTPTGDDSVWNYTTQAYDWKGRPTVTTNPDGSTRENTYGGCGCAGGEVVTGRDEAGRRTRTTQDWLGRLSKVEELNWDQSVYSTTNYAYNVRDQITSITQAGDRVRSFEYDGSGRLWHRITPEQGTTTYTYNLDDTANVITEARGATTTFGYNPRHLVTGITYGVPAGVAATSNVSLGYNAAGNRTSMTDGLGSVSYGYDQLSRLTSETRTLTGVGSFALNYQYNVAGELTSVTNPWSAQAGYNYDKVGQVTGVTGSGYYGVTSYINSLSYRAFGAAKQINYANGKTLLLQYNNRMWLSRWDLSGILGYDYNYNRYGEGNTGRPDYAHNLYDSTLDRAWTYDQVGRLTLAYTGNEANAIWGSPNGPYAQSFTYDPWGDITARAGWGGANASYAATFNSKNQMLTNPGNGQAFSYDAGGNITYDGGQAFTYDAAGKQVTSSWNGLQQSYDGDGLRGKKVMDGVATYYLHSSVLGGQVVAEINASGGWTRGYVYLGGQMLAIQQSGVTWVHQEPLTKAQRLTNSNGNVTSTIELDPFGGDTSRTVNGATQPHTFTSYERDTTGGMDEAMMRRYHGWWSHFDQPDPYDGSYDSTDPQSFNRYAYVQNDPVNFVDPTGLDWYLGDCHLVTWWYDGWHTQEVCFVVWKDPNPNGSGGGPDGRGGGPGKTVPNPQGKAKPKCKQDPNGGDIPEIRSYLTLAALMGLIDPNSMERSKEGITFRFNDRAAAMSFLNNSPSFRGPNIWPINSQHTGQVGGSAQDFRSYTVGGEALGSKSLQVDVGPKGSAPNGGAKGYADLDCSNPAQDVVSFFKHLFGH